MRGVAATLRLCLLVTRRADTLSRVRGEVGELKSVMVDNIEKVRAGRGPPLRPFWGKRVRQRLPLLRRLFAHHCTTRPLRTLPCCPPRAQVLGRGERLEVLVEKTESLGQQAFAFKRQARVLRRGMWWQNTRMGVTIAAAALLVAYALVCVLCSPTFKC